VNTNPENPNEGFVEIVPQGADWEDENENDEEK
jgi:hypothetical protein